MSPGSGWRGGPKDHKPPPDPPDRLPFEPPPLPPPVSWDALADLTQAPERADRRRVSIEIENGDPMRTRVMLGDVQIEGVQKIEILVDPKRVITRLELDRVFLDAKLGKVEIDQDDLVALCHAAGWSVDQMTKIER